MILYEEARKFRRKKLLEIKKKIKEGTAAKEEISFIQFWKREYGDEAF